MQGGSAPDRQLIGPAFAAAAAASLNREIRLPGNLTMRLIDDDQAGQLGIEGPTYVPRDRTVYFPWSFVDDSRRELPRRPALRGAMPFALYHETAHGIIDLLDVPVVGGEERAADSFAAIFAIRSRKGGELIPLGMAKAFKTQSDRERRSGPYAADDYADDHELDPQRAADSFCLVYGSDPGRYGSLVGKDLATRAEPASASSSTARSCAPGGACSPIGSPIRAACCPSASPCC